MRGTDTEKPAELHTILVVDDEFQVRDILVRVLQRAGYSTLMAESGEAALRLVADRGSEISLVLLDVMMPKMDGLEVHRRIKACAPEIDVVFCTGCHPTSEQVRHIRRDGLRMVRKPFTFEVLVATIQTALDARDQRRPFAAAPPLVELPNPATAEPAL